MSVDPRRPVAPEDRFAEELRQIRARLDQLAAPSGSQLNRNVDLLGQLRTYTITGGAAYQTGPGTNPYALLDSLTFTIDRPMSVLMQITAPYESSVGASIVASVEVTYEAVQGGVAFTDVRAYERWKTLDGSDASSQAFGVRSGILGAGEWSFQPSAACLLTLGGGAAGIDFITAFPVTATLTVLGPA